MSNFFSLCLLLFYYPLSNLPVMVLVSLPFFYLHFVLFLSLCFCSYCSVCGCVYLPYKGGILLGSPPSLGRICINQAPVNHLAISCFRLKLGPDLQSLPECCLTTDGPAACQVSLCQEIVFWGPSFHQILIDWSFELSASKSLGIQHYLHQHCKHTH